jgi:hypothetical protein
MIGCETDPRGPLKLYLFSAARIVIASGREVTEYTNHASRFTFHVSRIFAPSMKEIVMSGIRSTGFPALRKLFRCHPQLCAYAGHLQLFFYGG